ncbi:MAG: acyltransferase [Sphingomicrobium sp.]
MRERYIGLDGLRGVAALIVLLHHVGQNFGFPRVLPSGYLAVDFFFLLSGFVVSAAYEHRFADGPLPFFKKRLVRLVPTMWIGVLLGWSYFVWREGELFGGPLVAALLFMPLALDRFTIFMLNPVQWSLFFEMFANATHALCLWVLRTRALVILSLISFALLAVSAWYFGSVCAGDRGSTFLAGFPRVFTTYIAGMVIFRMLHRLPRFSIPSPFLILPAAIILAGAIEPKWLIELSTIALWPVLVIAGIQKPVMFPRLASWAGAISYPLYAVHVPALFLVETVLGPGIGPAIVATVTAVTLAAIVSILIERLLSKRRIDTSPSLI